MAGEGQIYSLNAAVLWIPLKRFTILIPQVLLRNGTGAFALTTLLAGVLYFALRVLNRHDSYYDNLPIVNRTFAMEPSIFARIRWAFNAGKILDKANEKYSDQYFRLARGDTNVLILPTRCITELNKLPQETTNSRAAHYFSLVGHLNGLEAVRETALHIKMLLARATPAIPLFLEPIGKRIETTLRAMLPEDTENWHELNVLDPLMECITLVISRAAFGESLCDNPELIQFCKDQTVNAFVISFTMRLVPRFLQPFLVWLVPHKWYLERSLRTLERIIVPQVQRRKNELRAGANVSAETNFISWFLTEAKREETDPVMLTRLIGCVIAGGTWSNAGFVVGVLLDLISYPDLLSDIREEIRMKAQEMDQKGGAKWDQAAFNSLDKLDSAMKETSRSNPSTLFVYSRVMQVDYTMSDGLVLKKGQLITTSTHATAWNPELFENPRTYDGLRAYNQNAELHRAQPFRTVDEMGFRWGSGRWACPGRFIASLAAKMILVKLVDEYEFRFLGDSRPAASMMHEFVFMDPRTRVLARKRKHNSGIVY